MGVQHAPMIDGCRIGWRIDGPDDAPVLLLSNSLGTDMDMWAPQLAQWTRRFRVLRYDSRGHGTSDAPAGPYSMDRLGRDAVELLDGLGFARVHFCGLSMGGMVGQWLATNAASRIDRLVLANTSAYMGPPSAWQSRIDGVLADGMAPLAEASIARWFTPAFPSASPDAVEKIRAMLLANDPVGYAGCCAAIRDMDQRLASAYNLLPTLVIAGKDDPSTSVADGEFLASRAAEGELAVLPAAHLSNVECPDAFGDAVIAFLERQ